MNFYVEKIIITGSGKTGSIIDLSDGINAIIWSLKYRKNIYC